jgi:hypothetical protein
VSNFLFQDSSLTRILSRERLLANVPLSNVKVIAKRRLDTTHLSRTYPVHTMPFLLYGTANQLHVDHLLLATPNIQLNSDQVTVSPPPNFVPGESYVFAHLKNKPEQSMQPFPTNNSIEADSKFFFKPGAKFDIVLTKDQEGKQVLGETKLTLGKVVFVDNDEINMFPAPHGTKETKHNVPIEHSTVNYEAWSNVVVSKVSSSTSPKLTYFLTGQSRNKYQAGSEDACAGCLIVTNYKQICVCCTCSETNFVDNIGAQALIGFRGISSHYEICIVVVK